jgi:sugar phosphate isomerase/epimerase
MPKPRLACQLYTVRALTHADFAGTMAAVRSIGYEAVELAGYGNLRSAWEVRKVLDTQGMAAVAMHTNLASLENSLPRLIEDCHTLGCRFIVLSLLPEPRRPDASGWRAAGITL